MERNGLLTQPPGVEPIAADGDGRRIPFVSIPHHTLILHARASAQYSLPRPRNGNFAHASRSDGPRNLLELQTLHRSGFLIVCCSDCTPASFPCASASFTHSHTLSLVSCCRPNAKSSSAGLSTLVCLPYTGFPMSTNLSRLRLFQRHLRSLVWVWVWVWFGFGSGFTTTLCVWWSD